MNYTNEELDKLYRHVVEHANKHRPITVDKILKMSVTLSFALTIGDILENDRRHHLAQYCLIDLGLWVTEKVPPLLRVYGFVYRRLKNIGITI